MRRGLAESRARAQEAVLSGRVLVSGSAATKAGRLVADSEPIELVGPPPRFVGRGGDKLDGALDAFALDVTGLRCLDVGSSTGGFTDCLLQRGAAHVIAVDVGRGQLAWSLRNDPRVTVRERTDIRDLTPVSVGVVDVVTIDVSFISLRTVLPAVARAAPGASVVALVKPQFEVGRDHVPRGGVVRDPEQRAAAVDSVVAAAGELGYEHRATAPSPLAGARGNEEVFVLLEAVP